VGSKFKPPSATYVQGFRSVCHAITNKKTPPPWFFIQLEFFLLVHAQYVGYCFLATILCWPHAGALITHFVLLYIWQGKQQSVQPQGVGNPSHKNGPPIGVSIKSMCCWMAQRLKGLTNLYQMLLQALLKPCFLHIINTKLFS
jgi:hypothetical protein